MQEKRWDKQSPDFPIRVIICLDTKLVRDAIFSAFSYVFCLTFMYAFTSKEKVYIQVKYPL